MMFFNEAQLTEF